jgi:type IV pilus assembly protein PilE
VAFAHGQGAGFTLIELMITVAIIAIIAAVGYPSYTSYVERSRIAEATGTLAVTRVRLEQYYQDNRNYGSSGTTCGVTMPAGDYFTFSCATSNGAQQFLLTATGSAGGMSGYTFTVDHNNAQRTTAFVGASSLPANCWLKRKGDTC